MVDWIVRLQVVEWRLAVLEKFVLLQMEAAVIAAVPLVALFGRHFVNPIRVPYIAAAAVNSLLNFCFGTYILIENLMVQRLAVKSSVGAL